MKNEIYFLQDLVKLQMGEYVSLGKVESILKIHSLVDQVCVCADPNQSFTVALIIPDEAKLLKMGSDSSTLEQVCSDPKIIEDLLKSLTKHGLNSGLEKFEIPKQIILLPEQWTPDSGMVTAAMKLKRKEIEKRYANQISFMYSKLTGNVAINMTQITNKVVPA